MNLRLTHHPRRRYSPIGRLWNIRPRSRGSLWLDAGGLDHLAPLLSFVGDELSKLDRCHWHRHAAEFGQTSYHLGIGEHGIDFVLQLRDDVLGRILGRAYAVP